MACCTPSDKEITTSCCTRKKRCCGIFLAILASVTLLGMACIVRDGLRDFQGDKRSVFVRGLSERDVSADLAAWPFALTATANELASAQTQLETQETLLREFLREQGLSPDALVLLNYNVEDLLAQQYRPQGIEQGRFVLAKVLLLRTQDVDKVEQASQAIDSLVKKGVALGNSSQPTYIFTGLNAVKPDMIREATANAYEAAQQFARDSGASVGDIISASQGVFSITGRDDIPSVSNARVTPDMQRHKKVRVVTSVTYKLD